MSYKQLINSCAVNLVIFGKKEVDCFESLSSQLQKELRGSYVAQLSDFDKEDLVQSIVERTGINLNELAATGKLTMQDSLNFKHEFDADVAYYISEDLLEAYHYELSNKPCHIAEYRYDFMVAA